MSSIEDMPELLEIPSGEDISANHLAGEELRQLHAGLAQLSPEQRTIVHLVYFEGLTRDEVAQRVGQTTATINGWLRSGLKQLKGALQP